MPDIPFLTTDQMREVDRLMIDDFQIELVQMMENAGRNLADISVPPELYARPGLELNVGPLFAGEEIIRVREFKHYPNSPPAAGET
jgi:hypothetical protein